MLVKKSACLTIRGSRWASAARPAGSRLRNTSGKVLYMALKSEINFALWRGVAQRGIPRERGEQMLSCTRLASIHELRTYATSAGSDMAIDSAPSERCSTDTSESVVLGGRLSRTVRKVSWSRTACQSLHRWCFSKFDAYGTAAGLVRTNALRFRTDRPPYLPMFGSRCSPMANACRVRIPANAQPSEQWLSLIR